MIANYSLLVEQQTVSQSAFSDDRYALSWIFSLFSFTGFSNPPHSLHSLGACHFAGLKVCLSGRGEANLPSGQINLAFMRIFVSSLPSLIRFKTFLV